MIILRVYVYIHIIKTMNVHGSGKEVVEISGSLVRDKLPRDKWERKGVERGLGRCVDRVEWSGCWRLTAHRGMADPILLWVTLRPMKGSKKSMTSILPPLYSGDLCAGISRATEILIH